MSRIVSMPDQSKQHIEASDWVSRIDAGLSPSEENEFREWLEKDDRNREAFIYLAHMWDDMAGLSRLADIFPDEELAEHNFYKTSFAIAASVLVAILTAVFFINSGTLSTSGLHERYETSIGEHSMVTLSDGSQLILNTNTLVNVSYKEGYRLITLERGEMHIDVVHDELRPLSVKAGDKVVQAVGTAFNIELYDNKHFELIVTDGKVRVGDRGVFEEVLAKKPLLSKVGDNGKLSLNPVRLGEDTLAISQGERVLIGLAEQINKPEKILEVEIEAALSWRKGNLAFNGESLEEAISEISRYTLAKFDFETEELKKVRVAGLFKSGDVDGLLLALEDSLGIYSKEIDDGEYRLYRKL